jgi:hypothetical protein
MANFARLEGGRWWVTFASGQSQAGTWTWGPGQHSMRAQTIGSGAAGEPWVELSVYYWHPARQQIRLLGLSPYASGVAEGTIRFDGEVADAVLDLDQQGHRRKMGLRWTFQGPDAYHEVLLEDTGGGLTPLAEWDHVRSRTRAAPPLPGPAEPPGPPPRLKAVESLLGAAWEGRLVHAGSDRETAIQTQGVWVPYASYVHARVSAPGAAVGAGHLFEAYIHQHGGTGAVRCLALSRCGAVYEGDLTVLDGGAIRLDLVGCEGDRVVRRAVRLDLQQDRTLRSRVWSSDGAEPALMLDIQHRRAEPGRD